MDRRVACVALVLLCGCGTHTALDPAANEVPLAGAASQNTTNAGADGGDVGVLLASGTASNLGDLEYTMDVTVPAGHELLRCIYAQIPSDRGVVAVSGAESHYTPGSHHVLAYRSDLTSIPPDQTGVWDCSDGLWQIHERGSYYEAQQPDSARELPAGIAHEFQPGEVVILQAHYINTTDSDVDAHVLLKMHVVALSTVRQEAGSLMFNDPNIDLEPHSKSKVTMICTLPQDIQLALLWSHMHSRGVHFLATTDDPEAAAALGDLFSEDNWSEPTPRVYPSDPAVTLHAGSHITFSCDYENTGDASYHFGNSAATSEMCLLHGMYWPRMSFVAEQCIGGVTEVTPL